MSTINQRLSVVRRREGISARTMARRLGMLLVDYELLETVAHELTVNELFACQKALDVPLKELLGIEDVVPLRANVLRVYKSALTLQHVYQAEDAQVIIARLIDDLLKIMPELDGRYSTHAGSHGTHKWPVVGQHRTESEPSRRDEFPISTEYFPEAASYADAIL